MPEGDSIRRLADTMDENFSGEEVMISTPRGAYPEIVERLSGRNLLEADAVGKNLFLKFPDDEWVHIHLGLFGKVRFGNTIIDNTGGVTTVKNASLPASRTDLQISTEKKSVSFSSLMRCDLINSEERKVVLERLGPDPLSRNMGEEEREAFIKNFSKSRKAVADALLDQSLVAGVGNILRAEILHNLGMYPFRRSDEFSEEELNQLWDEVVRMMKKSVKDGRIPIKIYRRGSSRRRCPDCGELVKKERFRGRTLHHCETCQIVGRPETLI